MKCGDTIDKRVDTINAVYSLFPIQYSECKDEMGRNYLIMERLDGDITSIFFNLLPKLVLEGMKLDIMIKTDIKMLFDIKIPVTGKEIIKKELQLDILNNISKNKFITLELYDSFIHLLLNEWKIYHNIIRSEMVKIQLKLIELNFTYHDMKFDNFGYKLSDIPLESDFRKQNVPKIFNKYFYIYFIDPESGLASLDSPYKDNITNYINKWDYLEKYKKDNVDDYEQFITKLNSVLNITDISMIFSYYQFHSNKDSSYNKIIYYMNNGYDLSVHGQYPISNMNIEIKGDIPTSYYIEVIKILQKNYKYDIVKKNYKTIEDVILSLSVSCMENSN